MIYQMYDIGDSLAALLSLVICKLSLSDLSGYPPIRIAVRLLVVYTTDM